MDNKREFLEKFFEKKFQYQKPHDGGAEWNLPPVESMYKEFYQFNELQTLKNRLNAVKSKLNYYTTEEWSAHTKRTNPAGNISWHLKNVIKAEFVTIAWCKFFECLHRYPLVKKPTFNSLHLCEAPGAFIAALNHYLYSTYKKDEISWSWRATTLNPYYEGNPLNKMVIDDRFILNTLDNWLFHEDYTGNLMDITNIDSIIEKCNEENGVQLITADGSIDCAEEPDCQEETVSKLHLAEIVTALSVLSTGGNFVIKMFTLFEVYSVSMLYLLNCAFDSVHIYKPATSKQGNSEVYVICLGFNKHATNLSETLSVMKSRLAVDKLNSLPMFAKDYLPRDFLFQHEICCRLFMNLQMQAIDSNIYAYEVNSRQLAKETQKLRQAVWFEYYKRYNVRTLPAENCILGEQKNIATCVNTNVRKGSYAEREIFKQLDIAAKVFKLYSELNEIEKSREGMCDPVKLENEDTEDTTGASCSIKIYKGKPITELLSSFFASIDVLHMRTQFQKVFEKDPIWSITPSCTIDDDTTIRYDSNISEGFYKMQHDFFVRFLNKLIEGHPRSTVVFSSFPFLTHLSVSILRFLSKNVFKTLEFSMTPPLYTITLKDITKSNEESSTDHLKELRDILVANTDLHCILNIIEIHRSTLSKILIKHNDCILIDTFKRILDLSII